MLPRRRATRPNARAYASRSAGAAVGTDEQAVAARLRLTTKLSRWFAPKSVSVRAAR